MKNKRSREIPFQAQLSTIPLWRFLNAHRVHKKQLLVLREFLPDLGECRKPALNCLDCRRVHFL